MPEHAELAHIGLLHHPKIPQSQTLAAEIAEWLRERGRTVWLGSALDEQAIAERVTDFDLIIPMGGDGTTLRTARMTARHGVPILGVNLGRVGFLAELTPDNWRTKFPCLLEGRYWIEERMMLYAEFWRQGERQQGFESLNDVVISRGELARIVRLPTYIDGGYLTTYVADGLIVATATGSTAYALAVGGPILPPELKNILLVPIAPHLSLGRAIVLSQGVKVKVEVSTGHRAILTIDGQFHVELQDGDLVLVQASPHTSRFVRLQDRMYLYQTLMDRLCPIDVG
ncbi:MAG: NAD(+)/NADH kinase [Chloroflexota bacterium]|nr:NAD(+)/NADH kinase [Chloroflexota bacterium]